MEVVAFVPSAIANALTMLKAWIVETVIQVLRAADGMFALVLGFTWAVFSIGLILYAMGILNNFVGALFVGEDTVGQVVAKSLGKTMGGIAAAWEEGWATADGKGKSNGNGEVEIGKQDGRVRDKEAGTARERDGLRLVAGQSLPGDTGDFKSVMQAGQPPTVAMRKHGEAGKLVEDGELVENNWAREL